MPPRQALAQVHRQGVVQVPVPVLGLVVRTQQPCVTMTSRACSFTRLLRWTRHCRRLCVSWASSSTSYVTKPRFATVCTWAPGWITRGWCACTTTGAGHAATTNSVCTRVLTPAQVSPNKIHSMAMPGWIRAFPNAKVFASPGLAERRKDIRFDATLTDEPEAVWSDQLDQVRTRKSRTCLHRPATHATHLCHACGGPYHARHHLLSRSVPHSA